MAAQLSHTTDSVQSIMSVNVQTIDFNMPLADALRLMAEDNFNAIPVVNGERQCIGMLSRADLTETLFVEDQKLTQLLAAGAFGQLGGDFFDTCGDKQVREVMTHEISSVNPETSIQEACKLMASQSIHHLPVVTDTGALEGIVSSFDIIKWLSDQ